MPELPEVQTTVDGLNQVLPGKVIIDVWSSYDSSSYKGKEQIKDRAYFKKFKKEVVGKKFLKAERRGKNILLHLSEGETIVVHMKMTGHLLYGKYRRAGSTKSEIRNSKQIRNSKFKLPKQLPSEAAEKWEGEEWLPDESASSPLWDPWNRHIRLVFALSNGKHLVLSDARKFAKVFVIDTDKLDEHPEVGSLGPNPLELSFKEFIKRIQARKTGKIKQVLMDQKVLAGIGNIYSDEALWETGIHPASDINKIPEEKYKKLFKNLKGVLKKGIKFAGDSTSDYRRPDGNKGEFQKRHKVYQRKGKKCERCGGKIKTAKVGGRTSHFCPKHQKKY